MRLFELNDDVLVKILESEALTVIDIIFFSSVCRRARTLAHNPVLWRDVSVAFQKEDWDPTFRNEDQKEEWDPTFRKTKRARKPARCRAGLAIESISLIAGDKLKSLDLTDLRTDRQFPCHLASLSTLASRCPFLHTLSLPPSRDLRESQLCHFARSSQFLRQLYLPCMTGLTVPVLARLLQERPEITHLSVAYCSNIRGSRIWDALKSVAPELEFLDISGTNLTSLPLAKMSRLCPMLEALNTNDCRYLKFPRVCHNLMFPNLLEFYADIIDISRSDFRNEFIRCLFQTAKLRVLSLRGGSRDVDIALFAKYQSGVSSIEHLVLSGQENLSDRWFRDVVLTHFSKTLRFLDVSNCRSLSGASLTASHRLPSLEDLNVSGTRFTTEAVTILVLHVAPNLRVMRTDGCRSIVDRNMRRDPLGFLRGTDGL